MEPSGNNSSEAPPRPRRRFLRLLRTLGIMMVIGWIFTHGQLSVGRDPRPAGFGQGLWHGAVMPAAFPLLLAGKELNIYAPHNTGTPYKLGYTLGVNLCGLVFFGFFFTRLSRWRRLRDTQAQGGPAAPSDPSSPTV